MAVYFTKGSNPYSSVGAALGTGLTKGLDALAKDKIHNMLQQKKEAHLSKLLQAVNYNEPTANILANLAHLNPNHFHDYLEMVGSGGQQQPVGGQQEQLGQQFAAPEQNFIQPNMNQQNMGEQNNLTSVLSPESQQFEKLSTDFLKNAKDLFGSRITDQEVQNFLKTIPSLTQSNSGKIAVIENLKDFNEAAKVKRDITNELLKKYGSNLPANFEDQVEELARPSLDALAEKFKKVADINPAAYAGYSFPGSGFFR